MKSLSIKTQRILALLPIINTIGIFVFLYRCAVIKIDKKTFIKTLFLIFPVVILFGVGMAIIDNIFGSASLLYRILSILSFYFYPALVFLIIIYAQKNFLRG
jgi:hypothetical protein